MSDRLAIEQQDAIGEVVRWLELFWRQRWLVLAVTSAVFLLGTVYGLTRASQYEVITLIDIGLRDAGRDSSGRQIETTDASLGRLSQVYLPQLRRERRTARKAPTIAITASAARGASILQLRSLATTSMIPEHIAMQQAGAAFLLAEHGSQFAALRAAMEREIKSLEAELLTVQELEPLQVELTRLEKEAPAAKSKLDATAAGDPARPALAATQVALELRLRELQAAVASMTRKNELFEAERALKRQRVAQIRNRLSATRAAATAKSPTADSALHIDVMQLRDLDELNQLEVQLVREDAARLEEDRARAKSRATIRDRLLDLNRQFAFSRPTQIATPPTASDEPTGSGRKVVIMLSALAALFLGLMAALARELATSILARMRRP